MSWVNWEPQSRIRMREDIGSELPVWLTELDELHGPGLEVQDRGRRRSVDPSARLSGIDDQRVAARLHALLVLEPVHHEVVALDGPRGNVSDVVDDQDLGLANGEAVRGLEQL